MFPSEGKQYQIISSDNDCKMNNKDHGTRVEISPDRLDDMRVVSHAFNDMLDNLQAATNELENWSRQLEYKVQRKTEELGAAQNELMHVERLASL